MEKLTEQEAHEMIAGKLTRYFGVSAKEATREQIYKAVVMSIKDLMLQKRQKFYLKTKNINMLLLVLKHKQFQINV